MQQKDYILREIEKISVLILAFLGKLKKSEANTAISTAMQMEAAKESLYAEIGFDLTKFMSLGENEIGPYLSEFQGMNTRNRELLADLIKEIGEGYKGEEGQVYLIKALIMYQICNVEDKTYSFDRERKIEVLKSLFGRDK